jgi:membrane protease YdiL (CAAX protease family)
MTILRPWIHIAIAVSIYIFFALAASKVIQKIGGNVKEMKERSSGIILLVGGITNCLVLIITLLLLNFLDARSISDLGIAYAGNDVIFTFLGVLIIFSLASAFVLITGCNARFISLLHIPFKNRSELGNLSGVLVILFFVALQEEILYRGYITLNLLSYGPTVIIIVSAVIFTTIHLFTNRADIYQLMSWLIGGAILSYIYIVSGSIWVVIILHFTIDATNVIVFNIIGKYSIFPSAPQLSKSKLTTYRLAYTFILIIMLLTFYGPVFNIS